MKYIGIFLIVAALGVIARFHFMDKKANEAPNFVGLMNGSFKKGPDKPNWVSSMVSSSDKGHYIAPIDNSYLNIDSIAKIIELEGGTVLKKDSNYLHAIFQTKFFKFIDDIQFLVQENTLHMMSSSRVGHSDLGANRKRLEGLRMKLSN